MLVVIVADGRSPTTRRWIEGVIALGHRVVLISTFPCAPLPGIEADVCLPVAFAGLAAPASGGGARQATSRQGAVRRLVARFRGVFLAGRYRLGPLTLRYYGPRFHQLVSRIQPDLVHALRIPFEGMLAAYTPPGTPLAVSIWGNDLTLHAAGSAAMGRLTRDVLRRADALLTDAARDIRLGRMWGFAEEKPALVVPGGGGLDLAEIRAACDQEPTGVEAELLRQVPAGAPLVINPRGLRTGSVRTDTFFAAIPLVLERRADVVFVCPAMAGQAEAEREVERRRLQGKVYLLPHLPQAALWRLFRRAAVSVSISQHDGTPNSLLEAMACGCLPVAGDIESIREWITPGVNGLLVEPHKPQAAAEAILIGLEHAELRRRAAEVNVRRVAERAGVGMVRAKIAELYAALVGESEQ